METYGAPVCRYKFLFEKPVLYTRSISLSKDLMTNVKFLVISHNKAYDNYCVFLYGVNENVNWKDVMNSKYGFVKLRCSDTFFLENSKLDWFLEHFGLKQ